MTFLGFQLLRGKIRVSTTARLRFKDRVRELTRRNNPLSMYQVIYELSIYLRGWVGYFGIQEFTYLFRDFDAWIRSRLRSTQLKKWKKPRTFQRIMIKAGFDLFDDSQADGRNGKADPIKWYRMVRSKVKNSPATSVFVNKTEDQILADYVIPFVSTGVIMARWGAKRQSYQVPELRVYRTNTAWVKPSGVPLEKFIGPSRSERRMRCLARIVSSL